MDLSVVIVSYNVRELLRNCLRSVYEQTREVEFEVFVVDNHSQDNSVEMVEIEFPQVNLIANQKNYGFAAANNQALKEARGRYLLLLNPDTVVLSGALDKMVDFMDRHPDAGALGCRILNPDRTLQPSCHRFPTLWIMLFWYAYLNRIIPTRVVDNYMMRDWNHDDIREVDHPRGACLMVRRETSDQVGFMDEGYFIFYEELDWCFRIKHAGWKIYFTPEAEIIHYLRQSVNQEREATALAFIRSECRFFKKHYGLLSMWLLKPIVASGLIIRAIKWLMLCFIGKQRDRGKRLPLLYAKMLLKLLVQT